MNLSFYYFLLDMVISPTEEINYIFRSYWPLILFIVLIVIILLIIFIAKNNKK